VEAQALSWGVHTDVGRVRKHNEDCAAIRLLKGRAGQVLAVAVADGMGGHLAGEVASKLSVQAVFRAVRDILSRTSASGEDLGDALEIGIEEANAQVYEHAQADNGRNGMGTTLTAALIQGDVMCVAHVGDSRAILVRDGQPQQLTKDHSLVQVKVDAGLLTPQEAALSQERNVLVRAIGTDSAVQPDVMCLALRSGDVLLFLTDGAHGSLREDDVADAVGRNSTPYAVCRDLVNRAKIRDGADNITAACVAVGAGALGKARSQSVRGASKARTPILAAALVVTVTAIGVLALQLLHPTGPTSGPETVEPNKLSGAHEPSTVGGFGAADGLELRVNVSQGSVGLSCASTVPVSVSFGDRSAALRVGGRPEGSSPQSERDREGRPATATTSIPTKGVDEQLVILQLHGDREAQVQWKLERRPQALATRGSRSGLRINGGSKREPASRVADLHDTVDKWKDGMRSEGVVGAPLSDVTFYLFGGYSVRVRLTFGPPQRARSKEATRTPHEERSGSILSRFFGRHKPSSPTEQHRPQNSRATPGEAPAAHATSGSGTAPTKPNAGTSGDNSGASRTQATTPPTSTSAGTKPAGPEASGPPEPSPKPPATGVVPTPHHNQISPPAGGGADVKPD
jgi:protein phosphatase